MIAAVLALAAGAAEAPTFTVTNQTKAPVRCMIMEGGPITHLVTLARGKPHAERLGPGARVSLACPKLRDTVFGPVGPGRYVLRTVNGRTELAPLP
jgi:hypothetical protein